MTDHCRNTSKQSSLFFNHFVRSIHMKLLCANQLLQLRTVADLSWFLAYLALTVNYTVVRTLRSLSPISAGEEPCVSVFFFFFSSLRNSEYEIVFTIQTSTCIQSSFTRPFILSYFFSFVSFLIQSRCVYEQGHC